MNGRHTLIAGPPASGKSTLARLLGEGVLEFDSIARQFGSYEELYEERELAVRIFHLKSIFCGYKTIVDTFHTIESRKETLSFLQEKPDLIMVDCSLETCLMRNSSRIKSMVSNDELRRIYLSFEPASIDEGFNSIWIYKSDNC